MKVNVETIHVGGEYKTNCYLLENTETKELILIDPGSQAELILEAIGERTPVAVLITHGHFDHFSAVDEICGRYDIPMYIHALDAPKLTDARMNESITFGFHVTVKTKPNILADGQTITLGGVAFTVLHTPGHSKGGVCYLLPENQGIFCGDTLFLGGYGRFDFGDGNFSELKQSLRKLINLHPKMIAYPGHGETTFAGKDA
ncbi:MAG TPA: MBL fold metallo-hydrolase [Candidatus Limiplasma sp.]|nr:MBL fold metallo-hydrolase [Candidatus Limiplasma sp.]HRX08770.1 MBL fold metallo-hydrolase [Candidatus Limiplasma sp.]